jgi:hypothetical protein
MGQTHGDLRQTAPQFALALRGSLPGALQHLVRVERATRIEQSLRLGKGLVRGSARTSGTPRDPGRVARKRPTEFVARAGVAGRPAASRSRLRLPDAHAQLPRGAGSECAMAAGSMARV